MSGYNSAGDDYGRDLDEELEMDDLRKKPRARSRTNSRSSHEETDTEEDDITVTRTTRRTRSTTPPTVAAKPAATASQNCEAEFSSLLQRLHAREQQDALSAQQEQIRSEQRRLTKERDELAAQRRIAEMEQESARRRLVEEQKRMRFEQFNQRQNQLLFTIDQARITGLTYSRMNNFDLALVEFHRGLTILAQFQSNWDKREDRDPFDWNAQSGAEPKIQEFKLEIANCIYEKGDGIEAKRLYNELDSRYIQRAIIRSKIEACDQLIAQQANYIIQAVALMPIFERAKLLQAKSELARARSLLANLYRTSDPQLVYQEDRIWWFEVSASVNTQCLDTLRTLNHGPLVDCRPTVLKLRELKDKYERANRQQLLSPVDMGTYNQLSDVLPDLENQLAEQVRREQREAERKRNVENQQEIHANIPKVYEALQIGDLPRALSWLNNIIVLAQNITKPEDIVNQEYTPPELFAVSQVILQNAVDNYTRAAETHSTELAQQLVAYCVASLTEINRQHALLASDISKLQQSLRNAIKANWFKFEHINPSHPEAELANAINSIVMRNFEVIGSMSRWWNWHYETVRFKESFNVEVAIKQAIEAHPNRNLAQPTLALPIFAQVVVAQIAEPVPGMIVVPAQRAYPSL